MVRMQEIQKSLLSLVGWRQSQSENRLSDFLTQSESGLYYQDAHPLLTLENLESISPDFSSYEYPIHSSDSVYKAGEVVMLNGTLNRKCYKAIKDVPENIAIDNAEYWIKTNPFSEWLETKTKASITRAITNFINEKVAKGTYKTLCEKKTLFDGTGRIYDTVANRNNFVGLEITPIRAKGVTTKINRIGLQFTEPGEYTIVIMHSSLMEPFYQETFIKKTSNSMEWFIPSEELYLPYENERIDAGGSWYIGYLQSDLPVDSKAIRKNRDWSKGPCNECSRHEYETWRLWSKYIEVYPFYVNSEFVPVVDGQIQMWDIEDNLYDYSTNYGINLDISVACDITDFIIEQKMMFSDYLSKFVAVDFLRDFAYNPNVRTNRHSINASRPDILYEIDGDSSSIKKSGMGYQLELSSKALQISTEGIDRVCMPCVNHGIKYRTV